MFAITVESRISITHINMTPIKFISRRCFRPSSCKSKQLFITNKQSPNFNKKVPLGCYLLLGLKKKIQIHAKPQV